MNKDALYYPHIALNNPNWIKAMSLLYDNIYRIVPDNVIPEDHYDLHPLLEEGSVGKMIDPIPYSKNAADEFLPKLGLWDAAAFDTDPEVEDTLERIHEDKMDHRVKELFREAGFQYENQWVYVPTEMASQYMLYLANDISKKNNLALITGDWGAWTGMSYFNLDGHLDESLTPDMAAGHLEDPFGIFSLIVSQLSPINISEIPAEDILKFRMSRADEMANFRNCIGELSDVLAVIDSNEIKQDLIQSKVKELDRAKNDYQKSADIIRAKGWFGVSMMGFPAPLIFGKLMSIPTASTVALGATGLALGAMYSTTASSHELSNLRRENQASMIIELDRHFEKYTSARGGGDINYHAWNCMNEFVND